MIAKGGAKLINNEATLFLKNNLIKHVHLITPNIPEAEILTGIKINSKKDMILSAKKLIKYGAQNVLIKGGHLSSALVHDILVNKKEISLFNSKRIKTKNTSWYGLYVIDSSNYFSIMWKPIKKSCELAIKYVNSAVRTNPNFGKGHGPINHLVTINLDTNFK